MATPRKHWFRVADWVLHEYPPEERGILVGFLAYANIRRARNSLTPEEASEVVIDASGMVAITGRKRLDKGRLILSKLLHNLSLTISYEADMTIVKWPKLSDFQEWQTRRLPEDFPKNALSGSGSGSGSGKTRKERLAAFAAKRLSEPGPPPRPPEVNYFDEEIS